jgi:hypothetical protein
MYSSVESKDYIPEATQAQKAEQGSGVWCVQSEGVCRVEYLSKRPSSIAIGNFLTISTYQ